MYKGFRGLARIKRYDGSYLSFRFTNADVGLSEDVNVFLPSYGGSSLYRIISPKVGDVSGRITLMLGQGVAQFLYDIAYTREVVELELSYKNGVSKKYTGVRFNQLSFSCRAGEIVQVSIDVIAKTYESGTTTLTWTGTNKLVTWDKCGCGGGSDTQSFTYTIDNNIVVIRTTESLLPNSLNSGIQKVSGNIVWFGVESPPRNAYNVVPTTRTFWADTFSVTHKIANHWTYRVPLTPELVVTTLDWTRVDDIV